MYSVSLNLWAEPVKNPQTVVSLHRRPVGWSVFAFHVNMLTSDNVCAPNTHTLTQVIGTWDFSVGAETTSMENARKFSCGLAAPNSAKVKPACTRGRMGCLEMEDWVK